MKLQASSAFEPEACNLKSLITPETDSCSVAYALFTADYCGAKQPDELAPLHSITSSARASSFEEVSRRSLYLSGQWLTFLDHKRRNGLNRRCFFVDALVDLAGFDVEGLPSLVGCGRFAFVVEREHSLLDIDD